VVVVVVVVDAVAVAPAGSAGFPNVVINNWLLRPFLCGSLALP
jgi:hypothetical protein